MQRVPVRHRNHIKMTFRRQEHYGLLDIIGLSDVLRLKLHFPALLRVTNVEDLLSVGTGGISMASLGFSRHVTADIYAVYMKLHKIYMKCQFLISVKLPCDPDHC